MIYWYQNLYMDETVEKNPKRCKKRVEKRRPWKKSYVVALTSDYDAAVEILQQILEKGYRENPEYNPRNVFAKKEFYPGRK